MSKPHDQEARAAVLAAILSGSSLAEISRAMKIPEATVGRWRDQAGLGTKPPQPHELGPERKADLGVRVGEYLDELLIALRAQASHTRDPEWLQRQNAHQLAILHGVLADKAIRILGALRSDEPLQLDAPAP